MTLLAFPGSSAAERLCSARSRFGSVKAGPSSDRAPTLKVSRRVKPSQARRGLPSMVSMGHSLLPPPQGGREKEALDLKPLAVLLPDQCVGLRDVGDLALVAVEV